MKLWRNVLVHVDGTSNTPEALEKALFVAEAFGGRVIAFDSIEPISGPPRVPVLRADRRFSVEAMVGGGAPGEKLLGCAARSASDLIVKATSAADVRQMTASGATALHLLRASTVPVWLYAPPPRPSGRAVALVNLSGSPSARNELDEQVVLAAARLSALEGAELHVVCVTNHARDRLYESILPREEYRRYLAKDREDLRRALTDSTARIAPHAVPHLVEGHGADALEKVFELAADTVILGRYEPDAGAAQAGLLAAERVFCRIDRSVLLVTQADESSRFRGNSADSGRRSGRTRRRATVASPAERRS